MSNDSLELLTKERNGSTVPVESLTWVLFGSQERAARKSFLVDLLRHDPVFAEPHLDYFHLGDRPWLFRRAFQKLRRVLQISRAQQLDPMEDRVLKHLAGLTFIGLHDNVFLPTLLSQAAPEQLALWLPSALSYRWIGCYAQTELAHGSNVRGLRTTCTYLPDADQFDLHTPDPSAVKWWPGCLGITATHAVVYARLIVHGVDHGVHNFLVQIRALSDNTTTSIENNNDENNENNNDDENEEDQANNQRGPAHTPLPGVTVGDIGPKMSTNDNDNGFLSFSHVRIPRTNMLMRHLQLDPGGALRRQPGPEKASYATMTRVRAGIVMSAGMALSDAATIALRYAAVRRQEPGAAVETPILNYASVQYCLLPALAGAYALRFVGQEMFRAFLELEQRSAAGDYSLGAITHATSCALKSFCTTLGADGIEECRRSAGGHGFHHFSAFPQLYGRYMPLFTAEGNNWLLTQQSARFLLKAFRGDAPPTGAVAYLAPAHRAALSAAVLAEQQDIGRLRDADALLRVFQHRAVRQLQGLHDALGAGGGGAGEEERGLRPLLIEQYHASRAHAQAITLHAFVARIEACRTRAGFAFDSQPLVPVLTRLCLLFALSILDREGRDFLVAGSISLAQAAAVLPTLKQLLAEIRPDAIALVDAFAASDWELNSALGRWDGDYIGTLFKWAQQDPLNQNSASLGGPPPPGFDEFLKPILTSKL